MLKDWNDVFRDHRRSERILIHVTPSDYERLENIADAVLSNVGKVCYIILAQKLDMVEDAVFEGEEEGEEE